MIMDSYFWLTLSCNTKIKHSLGFLLTSTILHLRPTEEGNLKLSKNKFTFSAQPAKGEESS